MDPGFSSQTPGMAWKRPHHDDVLVGDITKIQDLGVVRKVVRFINGVNES